MRSRVHTVLAVKQLHLAKTRLAGAFSADDRCRLTLAMLADTVSAAAAVAAVASITVVTPDPRVRAAAAAAGALVLDDPASAQPFGPGALNAAYRHAAERVRELHGDTAVLALQADLPALRPDDLAAFLRAAPAGRRAIVTDCHGTGTSALLQADPAAPLSPRFGPASARRHLESGAVDPGGDWPRLRLDVDTATDLSLAIRLGPGPATTRLLAELDPEIRRTSEIPRRIGRTGCRESGA